MTRGPRAGPEPRAPPLDKSLGVEVYFRGSSSNVFHNEMLVLPGSNEFVEDLRCITLASDHPRCPSYLCPVS